MRNKTVTVADIEVDEPMQMISFWFNELLEVRKEGEERESAHASISIDDLQTIVVPNGLQSYSGAELEYDISWDGIGHKIVNARLITEKKKDNSAAEKAEREHNQEYPLIEKEAFDLRRTDVGEKIEALIQSHVKDMQVNLNHMEGKILDWYRLNGKDPKFAEHFGIQAARSGSM